MRRSARIAKKPRQYYEEDYLWHKAVRKAKTQRDTKKKGTKKAQRPASVYSEEYLDPDIEDEKRGEIFDDTGEDWNERLERPQQRGERIFTATKAKRPEHTQVLKPIPMSKKQKHLLFMNPGDVPIKEAIRALSQNTELPVWTTPFRDQLVLKGAFRGSVVFRRFADGHEKREEARRKEAVF